MQQPVFRVLMLDPQAQDQTAWARDLAAPLGLDWAAPLTPDAGELDGLLAATHGLVAHHRPVTREVFVHEPVPFDHPYLTLDNVTLTPHIAGGKGGARQRQMLAVLENIARFARGEPLLHRIV